MHKKCAGKKVERKKQQELTVRSCQKRFNHSLLFFSISLYSSKLIRINLS